MSSMEMSGKLAVGIAGVTRLKCFGNTVTARTVSHDIDLSVTKSGQVGTNESVKRKRERERSQRFIVYTRCANELQFVSNLSRE